MAVSNASDLLAHLGHELEVVTYALEHHGYEPANVAIECMDCMMVLLDFDN